MENNARLEGLLWSRDADLQRQGVELFRALEGSVTLSDHVRYAAAMTALTLDLSQLISSKRPVVPLSVGDVMCATPRGWGAPGAQCWTFEIEDVDSGYRLNLKYDNWDLVATFASPTISVELGQAIIHRFDDVQHLPRPRL